MPSGNFRRRPRGQAHYAKPALTHQEMVDQLLRRGLDVPERERALRYLQHIGYYRLSPYMIPYQSRDGSHRFQAGATFDDVLSLYVFDRKLRLLVLDAVERVEVAARAGLTDVMSAETGNPHWYLDPSLFRDPLNHRRLCDEVRRECAQQLNRPAEPVGDSIVHRSALEHYLTTYATPELPPRG